MNWKNAVKKYRASSTTPSRFARSPSWEERGNTVALVTFAALLIGDTARQRIRRELVWGFERMTFKSPRTSNHCLIMFGTSFSSVVF